MKQFRKSNLLLCGLFLFLITLGTVTVMAYNQDKYTSNPQQNDYGQGNCHENANYTNRQYHDPENCYDESHNHDNQNGPCYDVENCTDESHNHERQNNRRHGGCHNR